MRPFLTWLVDTLLYCLTVGISLAVGAWGTFTERQSAAYALAEISAMFVIGWILTLPLITGRAFILRSLRRRETGSISRKNYVAISLVTSAVWIALASHQFMPYELALCFIMAVATAYGLSRITPVRIHSGGRVGGSE